jgi:selenide,water dikinase
MTNVANGSVRLTHRVRGGGCASKIALSALKEILATLPKDEHPDLLVGLDTSDDAGVIRLTDDLALIQTVDFFTPIVDDPYEFGRIAAANALSDVYAMGGAPLTALNIVCFPIKELPGTILAEILRGGADQLRRAGVHLAGGHSVDDPEPKFGLAVTGTIHPRRITTNAGARPGDVLVLTKALGTGILTSARKQDAIDDDALAPVIASMTTLNAAAADAMRVVGIGDAIHAATDITGFGLLGHLSHVVRASGVHVTIDSAAVPLFDRARELAAADYTTGGGVSNAAYLTDWVDFADSVPQDLRDVLVDPQTSGGLCVSVAPDRVADFLAALEERAVPLHAVIGRVSAGDPRITVS